MLTHTEERVGGGEGGRSLRRIKNIFKQNLNALTRERNEPET